MAMTKKTKHRLIYAGIGVVVIGGFIMYRKAQAEKAAAAAASSATACTPAPSFGSGIGTYFANIFG